MSANVSRGQHWTDRLVKVNPDRSRQRQRTIQNWANYRTPGAGLWMQSNRGLSVSAGPPPDWSGEYEFTRSGLRKPLQTFVRDSMDVGNRALFGCRLSSHPPSWINVKALDVVGGIEPAWSADGATATYPGLWPGCDLIVEDYLHKQKVTIRIWDKALAPAHFDFSIKTPASHTLGIDEGSASYRLIDQNGVQRLHLPSLGAHDSATTAPTPDGMNEVVVALTDLGPYQGNRRVRITPDPNDVANAVGDILIDPSTTISIATGTIEDGFTYSNVEANYGGYTYLQVGTNSASQWFRSLFRYANADIPDGIDTMLVHRLDFRTGVDTNGSQHTQYVHRVLGTRPWGEGTRSTGHSTENGAFDRSHYQHTSGSWTSIMFNSVGNDLATPSTVDSYVTTDTNDEAYSIDLTNDGLDWPRAWKAGEYANEGMAIGPLTNPGGPYKSRIVFHSTEGTVPPSVFIEYTAAAGAAAYYHTMMRGGV